MALSANAVNQNASRNRLLNKLNYAMSNDAEDIGTGATGDVIIVLDASDNYEAKYADADNIREITKAIVTVANENTTLLAANTGKPHLVANVSADRTFTLPSPAAGLEFEFIANAVVADGHDWIIDAGSDTNYFTGGVVHMDTNSTATDEVAVPIRPDGDSNSVLKINVPDVSTRVRVISDGTLWNVSGTVVSTTAPAFSNQA